MTEHLHITPIGNDGMYILDTASWRVLRPVLDQEKLYQVRHLPFLLPGEFYS